MNKITVSAKTVSDAITEASIELGVTSSSLEYEVIEKGSAGFLGIGAKQAVITAWKKSDKTPRIKRKLKLASVLFILYLVSLQLVFLTYL